MYVNLSEQTSFLDRGDGVCLYLDTETKLCTIYQDRPAICRVDLQYDLNYKHLYSWEEFVAINLLACEKLSLMDKQTK